MMRALLDTNIVYDLLCQRPYDQDGLMQLKVMQTFGDVELWISAKSYTDLFYVIRKEIGSSAAQDILSNTLSWLHVCSIDGEDISSALEAKWQDLENCLVSRCADKVGANYIITRDARGFRNAKVPCGTASEFAAYVFDLSGIRYSTENLI